ncbi:MAG TPA: cupin domain-containing protein [Opitutaceae bacterium]|nr:cupin domain-containing protein [Opitutaceae bacterium]
MPDPADRRFVQIADALREPNIWTNNEWLCRPDIVAAEKLLLVRANMDPMHCHPFHFHPHREEIIYVVYGRAEQWVGREHRILRPGEMAHIPAGTIHATYNPHAEPLVFLAILSPAKLAADLATAPDPQDVSTTEPWASIRRGLTPCVTRPAPPAPVSRPT